MTISDMNVMPLPVDGDTVTQSPSGLTLAALAEAKQLPIEELRAYGCRDMKRDGVSRVQIPYLTESGATLAVRYRLCLEKAAGQPDGRFRWRSGDKAQHLYGVARLEAARAVGWALIVEGESDSWTGWHYGLPVVGVPGKSNWKSHMAEKLAGLEVYIWQEPGAEDFSERIGRDLPQAKVIVAPANVKDISEAHLAGHDVAALLKGLRQSARPFGALLEDRRHAQLPELGHAARAVLESDDPLQAVGAALTAMGYGGDLVPALIVYLALSGRVLAMRLGTMPVHLLLLGPSSAGKSYTLRVVLKLMPGEAYHSIDAGSPRVLIYDDAELAHRVVVFSEDDSLPSGEDNPAASALRSLLQDHSLHYKVTVRDTESGHFRVHEVEKLGPTTLVTTSTRRLPAQLDTRVFTLEVPDDQKQIAHALRAQAELELSGGGEEPPAELVAFQSYLQALAPWDVVVPFVGRLAELIAAQPIETRVVRDFARLLSLIKACAVVRHAHREHDGDGRLVAELEDYDTVRSLVAEMYKASTSGAGEKVRTAVEAVAAHLAEGKPHASVTAVGKRLGIPKKSASRRVATAVKGGWLVNAETRKGYPFQLSTGEPLPAEGGLPSVEELGCVTVSAPSGGNGEGESSAQLALAGVAWDGDL
ncbi:MAG TPA: hypothetical protein VFE45_14670 [Coriobacteriia bacterium]|nr:hypothetical protein [Coriobacteriia bacterium]